MAVGHLGYLVFTRAYIFGVVHDYRPNEINYLANNKSMPTRSAQGQFTALGLKKKPSLSRVFLRKNATDDRAVFYFVFSLVKRFKIIY